MAQCVRGGGAEREAAEVCCHHMLHHVKTVFRFLRWGGGVMADITSVVVGELAGPGLGNSEKFGANRGQTKQMSDTGFVSFRCQEL